MSQRFSDRVAVVTGGVSGIGAQITRRLIDEGARVLAVDINKQLVESAAETFGPGVTGHLADVTDEQAFEGAIARAAEELGSIDVLFNVAGGSKAAPLTEMSYQDWDFSIRLNLYSVFLGIRSVARRFIAESKAGAIVNIASLNAFTPMHFGAGYSSSKAAVVMLTRQAALELAGHNIRVNAVSPGLVTTPLTQGLIDFPPVKDAFLDRIPMKRAAEPAEIAAAALFLASEDASYISGENLVVDGAWSTTGYPDLRTFMPGA
jgi:meso-butanediol dehydrogenase/(S,S)-butanediol dehydrogenase/diacetyl reductase